MSELIFYRYEHAHMHEWGIEIRCDEYKILKETPEGYWIGDEYDKHWISKNNATAKKTFARPTKEQAFKDLEYRTAKWLAYTTSTQNYIEDVLRKIDQIKAAVI